MVEGAAAQAGNAEGEALVFTEENLLICALEHQCGMPRQHAERHGAEESNQGEDS